MEKVSQLLTSLSPFQKPQQLAPTTRTTPTRVLPWKLIDSPSAEGKENDTSAPMKPFIPETAYINADVGVLRRPQKAYTAASFAPESQAQLHVAPRAALSEMSTNQVKNVRPSPKTKAASSTEQVSVTSATASKSSPKSKSPLAVADVRLNEILMGIDNLLNGMDAASKVEYSSQRRTPPADKPDASFEPSEPRHTSTIQAQQPQIPLQVAKTSNPVVPIQATTSTALTVTQQVSETVRATTEAFGQACSPVMQLPSFPGSPSPIRVSFNPLTSHMPTLQPEAAVKLKFEEAAVSAMKDWDRKHSEEFSRRLSLGKPAMVPVTPDMPPPIQQLDKEAAALPIVLTPDPPAEPASFADAAFRLDHAAHAAIIALFSERATASQLNKASVDLNEAIYKYQIETMHFLPPDNSRMRLRAKLMHRITRLNMNADPVEDEVPGQFPSPLFPAEAAALSTVPEVASVQDSGSLSALSQHDAAPAEASLTDGRLSLIPPLAPADATALGQRLSLEEPRLSDCPPPSADVPEMMPLPPDQPLVSARSSAPSTFRDWLQLPLDLNLPFHPAQAEADARAEFEQTPRVAVAPAMPQLDTPGVGMRIGQMGNGAIVVLRLFPDTPAEACGCIFQGDVIEAIDHKPLIGCWLLEVAQMVMGEDGTEVTLRLVRHNSSRFVVRIARCSAPVFRTEGPAAALAPSPLETDAAAAAAAAAAAPAPAPLHAVSHAPPPVSWRELHVSQGALPTLAEDCSTSTAGSELPAELPALQAAAEPLKPQRPLPVPPLKLHKVFQQQEVDAGLHHHHPHPSQEYHQPVPPPEQQQLLRAAPPPPAQPQQHAPLWSSAPHDAPPPPPQQQGGPPPRQPPLPRRRDIMMQMDVNHSAWKHQTQTQTQTQQAAPLPPRQRNAHHQQPWKYGSMPSQAQGAAAPQLPPRPHTARAVVAGPQRAVSGQYTARQGPHQSQGTWFAGNAILDGVSRMVQPTPLLEISNILQNTNNGLSSFWKPMASSRSAASTGENRYRVIGPVLETPPNPPAPPPLLHAGHGLAVAHDSPGFLTARRLNGTEVVIGANGPEVAYLPAEAQAMATHREGHAYREEGSSGFML